MKQIKNKSTNSKLTINTLYGNMIKISNTVKHINK